MKPNAMHWLCGLLVILSTFACTITGQVGFHNLLPVHTLFYGLATPFFLAWFGKYSYNAPFSLKVLAGILALLFSQFVTVGGSFYVVHSWALCFGDWRAVSVWLLRSVVYGYVFYQILLGILCVLINFQASSDTSFHLNYRRWFILIVAVRLIALFFFYPCVFGFDAAVGLRTYMDPDCATCNHHPFFIQFIHALFFSIGKGFGHLSVGMALLSLLSILFSSTILIYGLHLLKLSRLSRRWLLVIASLYAFFPLYPYLSVNPTKDGLFSYAFLLYLLTLYELAITQGTNQLSSRYLVLHNLAILLVCLTRHQGIYLVVFECVMLLFYYRSFWKSLLFAFIPSLCLILTYNHLLLPYYNVEPGGKQEVYGTLFQQTALYLKRYPKDVTPDEQASINNVLNCETMVAKYVFDKTDGVKNDYKYNPWYRPYVGAPSMFRHIDHTNEANDLKAYRSAWLSMGIRHPLVYIEATLAVTAGFFYNFNRLILETSPNWAANPAAITPEFHFAHFNTTARIYNRRIYSWFKYPVINWVIAIPYYNWIAIILLALLFYRKDVRGLIIFLPVLLSIGILLICPMIYGRYSYPIVISLPLLLAYIISSKDFRKSIN
jgi:hypothetical protein